MASIFEQYESLQKLQQPYLPESVQNEITANAFFRSLKLEDDSPIFSKQRINFQPNFDIVQMAVNSNHLVLAMTNNVLIRINLLQPQDIEELDLSKYCSSNGHVYRLFFDPSGQHLLVSLCKFVTHGKKKEKPSEVESLDFIYIPWQHKKIRSVTKLRDRVVCCVAWSLRNCTEFLSGPVICGTLDGKLFELELTSDESTFLSNAEVYCKELTSLDYSEEICGVEILPCPFDDLDYVILCCTKTRQYSFRGKVSSTENRPLFVDIFASLKGRVDCIVEYKGQAERSFLRLHCEPSSMLASTFAWTTPQGIQYGSINWNKTENSITDNVKILKVTRDEGSSKLLSQDPAGLVLTPFHMLIPHGSEISVVCVLSEKVLINDGLPSDCGAAVGICKDSVKNTIWLYTQKGIFRCKMEREDRNVWKMYLDQQKFDLAKKYCHEDQIKLVEVRMKEAEYLFQKGEFIESAKLFAHTLVPFEQIFFKLNSVDNDAGLFIFLKEKLNTLRDDEQGQYSLVTLIVFDYYFKKLGQLRDSAHDFTKEYQALKEEFDSFLGKPRVLRTLEMNSNAVYHLLNAHADQANIIKISQLIKAYDRVVTHFINTNMHRDALRILAEQSSEELVLQHLGTLLKAVPSQTVDFMMTKCKQLNPLKVVPILMQVQATCGCSSDIKRYLEFCVNDLEITESVLHNFLITIYASDYPNELLPYLKLQGDNLDSIRYDAKLALRECLDANQEEAAVHIYTVMRLYQEAVDLALRIDVNLAKATAKQQRSNPTLCKVLWLQITKYLVEESQDVEKALTLMKECDLIKIEDVLPFFPNFVTIDLFKQAICDSLKEYNKEIEQLKIEMDEASSIADEMRADIQLLKQDYVSVSPEDVCSECSGLLLERPFYLFHCGHKFHQDCLAEAVSDLLTPAERQQLHVVRSKLVTLSAEESRATMAIREERRELCSLLDDIVACECVWCGERIVNSIDKPYVPYHQWNQVIKEWS